MDVENIAVWSVNYIRQTIAAVTHLTGLGVCLYDTSHYLGSLTELSGIVSRHESCYCEAIRALPCGRAACIQSDVVEGVQLAAASGMPVMHVCHAGLTEVVVPILFRDRVIGAAFLGQCRLEGDGGWPAVSARLSRFTVKPEAVKPHYDALPEIERSRLLDAATLLDHALRHLVDRLGNNALSEYFRMRTPTHVEQACQFIGDHYFEPITARDVADSLHITSAHLTRLFKREMNMSVTDYITQRRIEKACAFLQSEGVPIASIAINVGYPDQNYFSRRFCKVMGVSPSAWRAQYKQSN